MVHEWKSTETQKKRSDTEKCFSQRLQTHPGVGALTALAFVLIIGRADRFQCGKQIASCWDWCH
jgi:Transposase IS116/IS110/IS902 family